ncbi:hypothetical protein MA16_Dca026197 [Dendrobium catenatum]|uniref:Uncharacterized protein n=1 Tax=Dendrobium catenatum TaxID=906689 RepID=A0A2I0VJE5_9ASPA|nr:hypothetical protein MA16_Dca026197 [Dendrobium catenatum]
MIARGVVEVVISAWTDILLENNNDVGTRQKHMEGLKNEEHLSQILFDVDESSG